MERRCFVEADALATVELRASLQGKGLPLSSSEKVRIMVLGSAEGVHAIVKSLHRLRFAEVTEWSHPLPTGRPGEVMRIVTKTVALE